MTTASTTSKSVGRRGTPPRRFTAFATEDVRTALKSLTDHRGGATAYRKSLTELGAALAAAISTTTEFDKPFALVSTPEDADYLTRGMLDGLPRNLARLVCYWTNRKTFDGDDVATVVQEFEDRRLKNGVDTVIVAKSIIASSCAVRTNLEHFLVRTQPRRIVIAAPVMLRGAEKRLKDAFPASVSKRFEFVTFAIDSNKDEIKGTVMPGVGGMVEERLGLKNRSSRSFPALVNEWRASA